MIIEQRAARDATKTGALLVPGSVTGRMLYISSKIGHTRVVAASVENRLAFVESALMEAHPRN
jgi:hypothetical protein